MFCSKCGKEINDTAKFCGHCGNSVIISPKVANECTTLNKKFDFVKNKKIIIILGFVALAIIGLIIWIVSLNNLEARLKKNIWYEEPYGLPVYNGSGYNSGTTYEFYSNGVGERIAYSYGYSGYPDSKSFEWELTDDNTLYFKGDYYSYGDEWYFEDDMLIIGEYYTLYSEDLWDYYT